MSQRIITYTEQPTQHTHYFLRGNCGPLRPLTDDQARQLRQDGIEIELPVTAPLKPESTEELPQ